MGHPPLPRADRHGVAPALPAAARVHGCRPNPDPTTNDVSALVFILIAAAAGWLADRMAPGRLPFGMFAAALAALSVSVLVALPLGDQGPHLFEVAVIPAAAGALGGAIALRLALARVSDAGG